MAARVIRGLTSDDDGRPGSTDDASGEAGTGAVLADLRSKLAAMSAVRTAKSVVHQSEMARGERSVVGVGVDVLDRQVIEMPPALSAVLPAGGMVRGTVVAMSGARSVLLSMIAAVTAGGGHVAIVGRSDLGLLAADEMGADLSRIAVIGCPGTDPLEIASILLDGLDVVVLSLRGVHLTPSRARVIMARLRSKGAVLVAMDGHWPGAQLTVTGRVQAYRRTPVCGGPASDDPVSGRQASDRTDLSGRGESSGDGSSGHGGRITGLTLTVEAAGRGVATRRIEVEWMPGERTALYAPSLRESAYGGTGQATEVDETTGVGETTGAFGQRLDREAPSGARLRVAN